MPCRNILQPRWSVMQCVSPAILREKNPLVFRRKREEGGLLDYAEETHAVKRFLDKIHPIRDELALHLLYRFRSSTKHFF